MDQATAQHGGQDEATPIFGAYRRGYDPEQVDRYVADQQRRLDETTRHASEAERKLAAAVGQLRELHRRVAVLESEERAPQPTPLDTLGERVQRILQEAWEGAYALRQAAEQEMAELREGTAGEAEAIVIAARQRARAIEDEIERRRNAYLEQVEVDRSRAVTQITHLHHEREAAVGELLKVKAVIEATVKEISRPGQGDSTGVRGVMAEERAVASASVGDPTAGGRSQPGPLVTPTSAGTTRTSAGAARAPQGTRGRPDPSAASSRRREAERSRPSRAGEVLAHTMPVQYLETADAPAEMPNASELVRSHRSATPASETRLPPPRRAPLDSAQPAAAVFDFDEARDS